MAILQGFAKHRGRGEGREVGLRQGEVETLVFAPPPQTLGALGPGGGRTSPPGAGPLPHIKSPSLARENPANEHDLDHIDELDLLVPHTSDAGLESGQLRGFTLGQALLLPRSEPRGDSGSEFGGHHPIGIARLGDVEPP